MINPFPTQSICTSETQLAAAVHKLLSELVHADRCVSLVFFGNVTIENFETCLAEIREVVSSKFVCAPLVSFIPQPMCGDFSYGLEATSLENNQGKFEFKNSENIRYVVLDAQWGKTILTEAVSSSCYTLSYLDQSKTVFEKIQTIFRNEDVDIKHIVRQWNYIGDIVGFENGNQHYQLFNNARSEFYKNVEFSNGFPAATGISMSVSCLLVSVMAIVPAEHTVVNAVNNALQKPAYNYSAEVLVEGEGVKLRTTPKFERGKLVVCENTGVFFVSGTAAIRDEKSSYVDNVVMQTRETIENINYLISNENLHLSKIEKEHNLKLDYVRVYVKNKADYESIKCVVQEAWPTVKTIFVQAEVCRPELLVEMEGIAQ